MLRNINRWLLMLLALTLLCLPQLALAGEPEAMEEKLELLQEGALPAPRMVQVVDKSDLETMLLRELNALSPVIDLSGYSVTRDQFRYVFQDLVNDHPELFFVRGGYTSYSNANGYVVSIEPYYDGDTATLPQRIADFNRALDAVVAYANRAHTPEGKLMLASDYLCIHYDYDQTYSIYDAESFFAEGTGVCQAYTLAYQAVLDKLGFESTTAPSNGMNHVWNVVKLNGSWYHIDVTWNDPINTTPLKARHNHLLLSDAAMTEMDHYGWVCDVTCTNTRYDNYPWRTADHAFSIENDVIYMTRQDNSTTFTVLACDLKAGGSTRDVFSYNTNTSYYYSNVACPVWATDTHFYYATYNQLYSRNRTSGETTALYKCTGDTYPFIQTIYPFNGQMRIGEMRTKAVYAVDMTVPVYTISIANGSMVLPAGGTAVLEAKVLPEPLLAQPVSWTVEDKSVATITGDALAIHQGAYRHVAQLNGGNPGWTRLTATLENGNSATVLVVVRSSNPFTLPGKLTSLGAESLAGVMAQDVIVPAGVSRIESRTFAGSSSLRIVQLPDNLTYIAGDAFTGCDAILLCRLGSATEKLLQGGNWRYIAY